MGKLLERVAAAPGQVLWLDSTDYAADLLGGGRAPWLDTIELVAWCRRTQSLLHSDVVAMPAWRMLEAWLDAHVSLREAMGARARTVYPLRTLLGDEALRAHVVAAAQALRSSFANAMLALVFPSPRRAVAIAHAAAFGAEGAPSIGEDETDSAAPYVADFLRGFGDAGLDVLLLEDDAVSEPASPAEVAWYQSVLNVAAHYRWDAGLRVPGQRFPGHAAGIAFVVAPQPLPGAIAAIEVPDAYWRAGNVSAPVAGTGFCYATIPADAQPELVLERLALLRVTP